MSLNSLTDIELWTLVKQSDQNAFSALYDRYWERVYTICYWHVKDQEIAKDIVQELFVELWVKRNQLEISKTIEGYLRMAVRNRVITHIRLAVRRDKLINTFTDYQTSTSTIDVQDNVKELRQLYEQEIKKLSDRRRDVYLLVHEHGFSISEVAEMLSIKQQSVKNSLQEARTMIRTALEQYRWILVMICLQYFFNNTVLVLINSVLL